MSTDDRFKALESLVETLMYAVNEAILLERVNRAREKNGLPIIYNPTFYGAAMKEASKLGFRPGPKR